MRRHKPLPGPALPGPAAENGRAERHGENLTGGTEYQHGGAERDLEEQGHGAGAPWEGVTTAV